MEKNLKYGDMLDIYKALLTDKQAEAMEYYYNDDYSLGEISELMDISRQGVRDFIKRGEAVVDEIDAKLKLEEKLKHAAQIREAAQLIKKINKRLAESRDIDALADQIAESAAFILE